MENDLIHENNTITFGRNANNLRHTPLANKPFILGVGGSRSLADERVKILILEHIAKYKPNYIVTHAEPEGVCDLTQKLCKEIAIPVILHFLNFKQLRGAFAGRSKRVLQDSTFMLFIHDGESKGTANEKAMADAMQVPNTMITIEKTNYKRSVGFEPATNFEWGTVDWSNE